jgi:GNAT superfamily N-acetyltransferase
MRSIIEHAASAAQLQAFRRLCEEYAESLDIDLETQGLSRELGELPGKYAPPAGRILLAMVNGEAVGCVALRRLDDGACEMKRLYVAPRLRALKLGRALVERLISDARSLGYRVMRLDTIAERMGPAVALYESFGFRPIPAYWNNVLPGAEYMELEL